MHQLWAHDDEELGIGKSMASGKVLETFLGQSSPEINANVPTDFSSVGIALIKATEADYFNKSRKALENTQFSIKTAK